MSFAPVVLTVAVVAAGLVTPAPRGASTTRYHLTAKVEQTVDLTGLGGPLQRSSLALDAWVVMTLTDSAGGKVVHVVVDSVNAETDMPQIQPTDRAAAKGATVHGFLDPAGRVKNLKSSLPANVLVSSVQGAVNGMFPRVRAAAKSGDSWVDTTDIANASEGNHTTAKVVTSYSAAGAEAVGGVAGVRVNATSTSTIGGTVDNPQMGSMDVAGTGSGKGTFVVAGDGRFLGGTVNSLQDLTIRAAMAPAPIPLKVSQVLTVTLVP